MERRRKEARRVLAEGERQGRDFEIKQRETRITVREAESVRVIRRWSRVGLTLSVTDSANWLSVADVCSDVGAPAVPAAGNSDRDPAPRTPTVPRQGAWGALVRFPPEGGVPAPRGRGGSDTHPSPGRSRTSCRGRSPRWCRTSGSRRCGPRWCNCCSWCPGNGTGTCRAVRRRCHLK